MTSEACRLRARKAEASGDYWEALAWVNSAAVACWGTAIADRYEVWGDAIAKKYGIERHFEEIAERQGGGG